MMSILLSPSLTAAQQAGIHLKLAVFLLVTSNTQDDSSEAQDDRCRDRDDSSGRKNKNEKNLTQVQ